MENCNNNKEVVDRKNSLLLKFDPLLKHPVPDYHNKPAQIVEEGEKVLNEPDAVAFETSIEETQSPPELDQLNEVPAASKVQEVEIEKSGNTTQKVASDETMSITFVNNNNVMKDVNHIEDGLKSEKIMRCVCKKLT